jgi:ATP/maltotriose-dependent transcriptional regulator MalT/DNA-binding SARP family transcriptional activator
MTLRSKILPAPLGPATLTRAHLQARLEEAPRRRVTSVVAGAGFGKSTLLAGWAVRHEVAWYTLDAEDAVLARLGRGLVDALRLRIPDLPRDLLAAPGVARGPDASADARTRADAFAAALCEALQERLSRSVGLVLDDLHELPADGPAVRVVEALCRQAPAGLYVVLASRAEVPFSIDRLRGQGQVLELGGGDLAFDVEEVCALLAAELDGDVRELGVTLHSIAGGWPAAVRLACETMRALPPADRLPAVERLRRPGGALFGYLAREVLAQEPPAVRELVRLTAPLERVHPELCTALGIVAAGEALGSLARRGLFAEHHAPPDQWFAPTALTREVALASMPLGPEELRALHESAAAWYAARGEPALALRSLRALGDHHAIASLLAAHGASLLRQGAVDVVVEAAGALPASERDPSLERLLGETHQLRGDWDEALRCLDRAAGANAEIDAGLAWRIGLIHHLRGSLDAALDAYRRGREEPTPTSDVALLHAWHASALWLRGDADACRALAARAHSVAAATGDDRALAAAHTVLAMLAALDGNRAENDAHYLRALEHAERARDVLQVIRIRVNRGSRNLEEGAYDAAIAELDLAIGLADLGGFGTFRALALTNRGESRLRLGRLEEAIADLEAARAVYQRLGTDDVAYALGILGDVYRERGDLALARGAYEESARRAEGMGDVQVLVPALAGLARVLAADDPDQARDLAVRAVAYGSAMGQVPALLALGHVALVAGDREAALRAAAEAGAAARLRRERAGLADALELEGRAAATEHARQSALEQAIAVWRELGNPLGEARAQLALAHAVGGARLAALGREAEARLRELGARPQGVPSASAPAGVVAIESLGGFRVLRDGVAIPRSAWRSRKARDLLKIIVVRHGRPVQRDALIEALWPGDDPARCANRLSVALSTLRGVLDPQRRFGADRFVMSVGGAVALDLDHVAVDLEAFLGAAATGLALREEGRIAEAHEHLLTAEAAYAGDLLEEDLYEDWAVAAREDARDVYVRVARSLATDARAAGDHDAAVRFLLRVLERDAYDEDAHLGLVAAFAEAARHGEARRAFRTYRARMDEIGVEPASFPVVAMPEADNRVVTDAV